MFIWGKYRGNSGKASINQLVRIRVEDSKALNTQQVRELQSRRFVISERRKKFVNAVQQEASHLVQFP